jgi:ABC-type glycerol-3-phosphate transport system substrate-binding protein
MRNTGHARVAKSYSADKNLIPNFLALSLLLCLAGLTAACGGLSQGASTSTSTSSGQTTPAGQLRVSIPSGPATVSRLLRNSAEAYMRWLVGEYTANSNRPSPIRTG